MRRVFSREGVGGPQSETADGPLPDSASPALRWYSTRWAYIGAIVIILGISAVWAATFGFLTIDSWNYLHLAQSIRLGKGCSVGGSYFAIFPCGYPLAIALTAPSLDLSAMIISSKVTNLILLLAAFYFLSKSFKNVLVPLLVIVNPFTIELYQYTWSENLFLFAFCASLFIIARMAREGSSRWYTVALACALIAGCSARYFFGLFSVVIFLATWITYGRRTAIRALPAFVAAAIFYLAYQKFNAALTGFGTGMPRPPAPETFVFLLFRFVRQLAREVVMWGVLLLILAWGLKRSRGWATASPGHASLGADVDSQAGRFLALCGAGYLFLAFAVRTVTQYDIYSPRLISYGLVFVVAAAAGLITRPRKNFYPAIPVIAYGAFCLLAAQAEVVTVLASTIVHHRYVSPADALERYRNNGTDADLIIELRPPAIGPTLDPYALLYYPKQSTTILIDTAPYAYPDSVDTLRRKIGKVNARQCVIDFTPFPTQQDIQRFVDESFPVGFSFQSSPVPKIARHERLDPSIRDFLLTTYQPGGRYVPCPF